MEENIVLHKVTLHFIFFFSFQINLGVLMYKSPQSVLSLPTHCLSHWYHTSLSPCTLHTPEVKFQLTFYQLNNGHCFSLLLSKSVSWFIPFRGIPCIDLNWQRRTLYVEDEVYVHICRHMCIKNTGNTQQLKITN